MRSVFIAGLPGHFGTWLAERLPGTSVQVTFSAEEAEQLAEAGNSLLLIDASVGTGEIEEALGKLRAGPAAGVPVIVTVDPGTKGVDEPLLNRLVHALRVERLLFHPLDRAELLRAVTGLLPAREPGGQGAAPGAAPSASAAASAGREAVAIALAQLWPRARGTMLERVSVLEQAARVTRDGRLVGALRQRAAEEAHRLAGGAGTFGLHGGTRIARELEARYAGGAYLTPVDGEALADAAAALRAMIEQAGTPAAEPSPAEPSAAARPAPAAAPATPQAAQVASGETLLVLTEDDAVAQAAREAMADGPVRVSSMAALPAYPAAARPIAVLLDVAPGDAGWGELARVAARLPGVAVIVATARGELPDRLRAVELGARGFLQKPLAADSLRDAVGAVLPAARGPRRRVLCLDDDPALLAAVRGVLEPRGLEVHTLSDPLRFWTRLGEVSPDLLVLDIEMPHVNGIELCRVVRADPRWRSLPVVFLTAHSDAGTVYRVFAAGADDFVAKPFVGPELVARIQSRVERVQR